MRESSSREPAGQGVLHLQQSLYVKHGLKGNVHTSLVDFRFSMQHFSVEFSIEIELCICCGVMCIYFCLSFDMLGVKIVGSPRILLAFCCN